MLRNCLFAHTLVTPRAGQSVIGIESTPGPSQALCYNRGFFNRFFFSLSSFVYFSFFDLLFVLFFVLCQCI